MVKDYECAKCNNVFEYKKSYDEKDFPTNPPCPKCNSTETKWKIKIGGIVIPPHMKSGR